MNKTSVERRTFDEIQNSGQQQVVIAHDTIVISDIHFGSPMCQAQALDGFLSRLRVQQLILAGDIFDDLRFHRLQHWHWQALSRIRKISDHCRVVWIRGNHDIISSRTMSHLLGVHVLNNYTWTSHGKSFYVVHGDCWDTFIYKHQTLTALTTWIYNTLQRINGSGTRRLSKWVKKKAKLLTRNSEAVKFGAVNLARRHEIDAIICGHTHMPALTKIDGIVYGNDGTWQSADPHFIGISGTRVDLCKYLDGCAQIVNTEWV
jgi:UDP-2,3-diacylglucosamine pyrophosphatase LpxH